MKTRQLTLIARREITELWRDGRLLIAGGLVAALMAAALLVNWQHQQALDGERRAAQTLDYGDWLKQSDRHPHDAAHQGLHVFKPAPPLAIIDPGITPFTGSTIWLQAHRQSESRFRPAQDATGLQRFGSLSVAWVLQVLGPLLVIILGFNVFAGEREQGTLRQSLSLGVSSRTLLWGKALALAAVLAMVLLPLAGASIVAVLHAAAPNLAKAGDTGLGNAGVVDAGLLDACLRLALLGAGYVLYLGIAVFTVLAVSALAPTSRVALVTLLGLWIASVMLAPRAASDAARHLFPSPSRVQFNSALNANLDTAYKQAWSKQLGTEKRWGTDLPLSRWGRALQVDDQAGYAATDTHFGRLWDSYEQQQRAQEWAGLLAPVLALRSLSMTAAGSGFRDHRAFSVAAETQRRLMQDIISDDLVKHADARGEAHFTYKAGTALWAKIPRFIHHPLGARDALRRAGVSLAVLLAGLAMALGLALWASKPRAG